MTALKKLSHKLGLLLILCSLPVEAARWDPGTNLEQIPIWPKDLPAIPSNPSLDESVTPGEKPIGGGPISIIWNVSQPTMTVYPPKAPNSGAAVVVLPGGGYHGLAIDLEGTEVCDWLTSKGITCILLKYRVPASGPYWDKKCRCHVKPKVFTALQDTQRTLGLVRANAAKLRVDPKKIGVIGFSAGGHLAAAISTNYKSRTYPVIDVADKESCRPDFAMVLYPGHMSDNDDNLSDRSKLNPDIPVTSNTPPTFMVHAMDDPVDTVKYSLLYFNALRKAKVPVEMHLFANGGHAFALRPTESSVSDWTALADGWLRTIGIVPKQ
ncbi:MAG: alpha/beta hydrolase [Bdellovibrio sp.]|nr:alpha/beta hydrolase [Bdellovibrio sp.]